MHENAFRAYWVSRGLSHYVIGRLVSRIVRIVPNATFDTVHEYLLEKFGPEGMIPDRPPEVKLELTL